MTQHFKNKGQRPFEAANFSTSFGNNFDTVVVSGFSNFIRPDQVADFFNLKEGHCVCVSSTNIPPSLVLRFSSPAVAQNVVLRYNNADVYGQKLKICLAHNWQPAEIPPLMRNNTPIVTISQAPSLANIRPVASILNLARALLENQSRRFLQSQNQRQSPQRNFSSNRSSSTGNRERNVDRNNLWRTVHTGNPSSSADKNSPTVDRSDNNAVSTNQGAAQKESGLRKCPNNRSFHQQEGTTGPITRRKRFGRRHFDRDNINSRNSERACQIAASKDFSAEGNFLVESKDKDSEIFLKKIPDFGSEKQCPTRKINDKDYETESNKTKETLCGESCKNIAEVNKKKPLNDSGIKNEGSINSIKDKSVKTKKQESQSFESRNECSTSKNDNRDNGIRNPKTRESDNKTTPNDSVIGNKGTDSTTNRSVKKECQESLRVFGGGKKCPTTKSDNNGKEKGDHKTTSKDSVIGDEGETDGITNRGVKKESQESLQALGSEKKCRTRKRDNRNNGKGGHKTTSKDSVIRNKGATNGITNRGVKQESQEAPLALGSGKKCPTSKCDNKGNGKGSHETTSKDSVIDNEGTTNGITNRDVKKESQESLQALDSEKKCPTSKSDNKDNGKGGHKTTSKDSVIGNEGAANGITNRSVKQESQESPLALGSGKQYPTSKSNNKDNGRGSHETTSKDSVIGNEGATNGITNRGVKKESQESPLALGSRKECPTSKSDNKNNRKGSHESTSKDSVIGNEGATNGITNRSVKKKSQESSLALGSGKECPTSESDNKDNGKGGHKTTSKDSVIGNESTTNGITNKGVMKESQELPQDFSCDKKCPTSKSYNSDNGKSDDKATDPTAGMKKGSGVTESQKSTQATRKSNNKDNGKGDHKTKSKDSAVRNGCSTDSIKKKSPMNESQKLPQGFGGEKKCLTSKSNNKDKREGGHKSQPKDSVIEDVSSTEKINPGKIALIDQIDNKNNAQGKQTTASKKCTSDEQSLVSDSNNQNNAIESDARNVIFGTEKSCPTGNTNDKSNLKLQENSGADEKCPKTNNDKQNKESKSQITLTQENSSNNNKSPTKADPQNSDNAKNNKQTVKNTQSLPDATQSSSESNPQRRDDGNRAKNKQMEFGLKKTLDKSPATKSKRTNANKLKGPAINDKQTSANKTKLGNDCRTTKQNNFLTKKSSNTSNNQQGGDLKSNSKDTENGSTEKLKAESKNLSGNSRQTIVSQNSGIDRKTNSTNSVSKNNASKDRYHRFTRNNGDCYSEREGNSEDKHRSFGRNYDYWDRIRYWNSLDQSPTRPKTYTPSRNFVRDSSPRRRDNRNLSGRMCTESIRSPCRSPSEETYDYVWTRKRDLETTSPENVFPKKTLTKNSDETYDYVWARKRGSETTTPENVSPKKRCLDDKSPARDEKMGSQKVVGTKDLRNKLNAKNLRKSDALSSGQKVSMGDSIQKTSDDINRSKESNARDSSDRKKREEKELCSTKIFSGDVNQKSNNEIHKEVQLAGATLKNPDRLKNPEDQTLTMAKCSARDTNQKGSASVDIGKEGKALKNSGICIDKDFSMGTSQEGKGSIATKTLLDYNNQKQSDGVTDIAKDNRAEQAIESCDTFKDSLPGTSLENSEQSSTKRPTTGNKIGEERRAGCALKSLNTLNDSSTGTEEDYKKSSTIKNCISGYASSNNSESILRKEAWMVALKNLEALNDFSTEQYQEVKGSSLIKTLLEDSNQKRSDGATDITKANQIGEAIKSSTVLSPGMSLENSEQRSTRNSATDNNYENNVSMLNDSSTKPKQDLQRSSTKNCLSGYDSEKTNERISRNEAWMVVFRNLETMKDDSSTGKNLEVEGSSLTEKFSLARNQKTSDCINLRKEENSSTEKNSTTENNLEERESTFLQQNISLNGGDRTKIESTNPGKENQVLLKKKNSETEKYLRTCTVNQQDDLNSFRENTCVKTPASSYISALRMDLSSKSQNGSCRGNKTSATQSNSGTSRISLTSNNMQESMDNNGEKTQKYFTSDLVGLRDSIEKSHQAKAGERSQTQNKNCDQEKTLNPSKEDIEVTASHVDEVCLDVANKESLKDDRVNIKVLENKEKVAAIPQSVELKKTAFDSQKSSGFANKKFTLAKLKSLKTNAQKRFKNLDKAYVVTSGVRSTYVKTNSVLKGNQKSNKHIGNTANIKVPENKSFKVDDGTGKSLVNQNQVSTVSNYFEFEKNDNKKGDDNLIPGTTDISGSVKDCSNSNHECTEETHPEFVYGSATEFVQFKMGQELSSVDCSNTSAKTKDSEIRSTQGPDEPSSLTSEEPFMPKSKPISAVENVEQRLAIPNNRVTLAGKTNASDNIETPVKTKTGLKGMDSEESSQDLAPNVVSTGHIAGQRKIVCNSTESKSSSTSSVEFSEKSPIGVIGQALLTTEGAKWLKKQKCLTLTKDLGLTKTKDNSKDEKYSNSLSTTENFNKNNIQSSKYTSSSTTKNNALNAKQVTQLQNDRTLSIGNSFNPTERKTFQNSHEKVIYNTDFQNNVSEDCREKGSNIPTRGCLNTNENGQISQSLASTKITNAGCNIERVERFNVEETLAKGSLERGLIAIDKPNIVSTFLDKTALPSSQNSASTLSAKAVPDFEQRKMLGMEGTPTREGNGHHNEEKRLNCEIKNTGNSNNSALTAISCCGTYRKSTGTATTASVCSQATIVSSAKSLLQEDCTDRNKVDGEYEKRFLQGDRLDVSKKVVGGSSEASLNPGSNQRNPIPVLSKPGLDKRSSGNAQHLFHWNLSPSTDVYSPANFENRPLPHPSSVGLQCHIQNSCNVQNTMQVNVTKKKKKKMRRKEPKNRRKKRLRRMQNEQRNQEAANVQSGNVFGNIMSLERTKYNVSTGGSSYNKGCGQNGSTQTCLHPQSTQQILQNAFQSGSCYLKNGLKFAQNQHGLGQNSSGKRLNHPNQNTRNIWRQASQGSNGHLENGGKFAQNQPSLGLYHSTQRLNFSGQSTKEISQKASQSGSCEDINNGNFVQNQSGLDQNDSTPRLNFPVIKNGGKFVQNQILLGQNNNRQKLNSLMGTTLKEISQPAFQSTEGHLKSDGMFAQNLNGLGLITNKQRLNYSGQSTKETLEQASRSSYQDKNNGNLFQNQNGHDQNNRTQSGKFVQNQECLALRNLLQVDKDSNPTNGAQVLIHYPSQPIPNLLPTCNQGINNGKSLVQSGQGFGQNNNGQYPNQRTQEHLKQAAQNGCQVFSGGQNSVQNNIGSIANQDQITQEVPNEASQSDCHNAKTSVQIGGQQDVDNFIEENAIVGKRKRLDEPHESGNKHQKSEIQIPNQNTTGAQNIEGNNEAVGDLGVRLCKKERRWLRRNRYLTSRKIEVIEEQYDSESLALLNSVKMLASTDPSLTEKLKASFQESLKKIGQNALLELHLHKQRNDEYHRHHELRVKNFALQKKPNALQKKPKQSAQKKWKRKNAQTAQTTAKNRQNVAKRNMNKTNCKNQQNMTKNNMGKGNYKNQQKMTYRYMDQSKPKNQQSVSKNPVAQRNNLGQVGQV